MGWVLTGPDVLKRHAKWPWPQILFEWYVVMSQSSGSNVLQRHSQILNKQTHHRSQSRPPKAQSPNSACVCHCWALLVCLKLCLISIWKIFDEKAADVYTHCVSHYIIYVKLICHIDNHFHSFSLCFTLPDLSSQALKLSPDWSAGFDLRQQKIAPDRQSDTPKSFFHPAINMERQVKSVQSQDWVLEFW